MRLNASFGARRRAALLFAAIALDAAVAPAALAVTLTPLLSGLSNPLYITAAARIGCSS